MYLTTIHAKRVRPAVLFTDSMPRVGAVVAPTVDGSIWLDPPGSFG